MLTLEQIEEKDIYLFVIESKLTEESMEKFYELMEQKANENRKFKVLGIIKEFPAFKDFNALSKTFKIKREAIKGIEKYAVLSDRDWVETLLPVGNFFVPGMPMKHFDLDERQKAIAWLEKEK